MIFFADDHGGWAPTAWRMIHGPSTTEGMSLKRYGLVLVVAEQEVGQQPQRGGPRLLFFTQKG